MELNIAKKFLKLLKCFQRFKVLMTQFLGGIPIQMEGGKLHGRII
jgi:hypothetical protein